MAQLKEKTQECFDFIKANGGRVTTTEIMEGLGLEKIASVTGRVNALVKAGLAVRDKVDEVDEGGEKPVTYVQLTEEGLNYVPTED